MNNNTMNVKSVKAPLPANATQPAVNKPVVGCGCDNPTGKHQGHGQKHGKR